MRTIVAGSRHLYSYALVERALALAPWTATTIISGGARGPDTSAIKFAQRHGIPVEVFEADWQRFGNGAGPRRNEEMARAGQALVAVWDGSSRGTADMIARARAHQLYIVILDAEGRLVERPAQDWIE